MKRACSLLVRHVFSQHILVLPCRGQCSCKAKVAAKPTERESGWVMRGWEEDEGARTGIQKTTQRHKTRNSASRQRISASRHMPIAPRGRIGSNLKAQWAQILRAGSAHPGDGPWHMPHLCNTALCSPQLNTKLHRFITPPAFRLAQLSTIMQLRKTRTLNLLT